MNYFLLVQLKSGPVHVNPLHFQVFLVPGSLLLAQVWMVDVEDQDDPGVVALVVDLMLEAVVKDDHLSLLPGEMMLGHPEPGRGVGGDDERKVGPELGVGQTTVRPDMSGSGHHGELDLTAWTRPGLVAEWSPPAQREIYTNTIRGGDVLAGSCCRYHYKDTAQGIQSP